MYIFEQYTSHAAPSVTTAVYHFPQLERRRPCPQMMQTAFKMTVWLEAQLQAGRHEYENEQKRIQISRCVRSWGAAYLWPSNTRNGPSFAVRLLLRQA